MNEALFADLVALLYSILFILSCVLVLKSDHTTKLSSGPGASYA